MHRVRLIGLVTLALAPVVAGASAHGATAAPQCVVQLRVNVFGSSPGSHWALQGGLNAGAQATLRAVARGCGVDHISRRWVTGGSGGIGKRPCSGATTCIWKQSSPHQSAADYQAYATSGARSNIVRVAWAGGCTAVGTWIQSTQDIGSTSWEIMPGGHAQETGIGNATGMATLAGHTLMITFVAAGTPPTTGVYTWTLAPNCKSGQGTLRFTGSRAGETHPSTVTKNGG